MMIDFLLTRALIVLLGSAVLAAALMYGVIVALIGVGTFGALALRWAVCKLLGRP